MRSCALLTLVVAIGGCGGELYDPRNQRLLIVIDHVRARYLHGDVLCWYCRGLCTVDVRTARTRYDVVQQQQQPQNYGKTRQAGRWTNRERYRDTGRLLLRTCNSGNHPEQKEKF